MPTSHNPNAAEIWEAARGELQLQLPRETYNTWLRDAELIAHEDGTYIIGVHNIYAREWLEKRLKHVIVRTLGAIARRSVEVNFVPWTGPSPHEPDLSEAGPLLVGVAPEEPAPARFEELDPGETGLNERYTFETFAIGSNNQLAYAAALEVIAAPAYQFNPLYLYASVGLGKSHLLHAIGHACAADGLAVLYVSSETFTNDLVASIKNKSTRQLREKYRTVDVLLVDDVQFIAGKASTQEEFYHTFNALFDAGCQIVLAADRPPSEIGRLDARLRSRFEGGLLVELHPPDHAIRADILSLKIAQRGYADRLPRDVVEMIAHQTEGSVRDLEGALNRVIASTLLTHERPTVDGTHALLNQPAPNHQALSLDDIILTVAEYYQVDPQELCGRSRSREVSTARQVVMYLAREETDTSLPQIGEALGGRNHSTVLYSCERVADLMATDSLLRRQVKLIMQTLHPHAYTPERQTPE